MITTFSKTLTSKAHFKDAELPQLRSQLQSIKDRYGKYIDQASKLSNIPASVLTAFICIESGGDQRAVSNAGAVGLMQLVPAAASDMLYYEVSKKRLTKAEEVVLRKQLDKRLDCILSMKFMGHKLPCNNNSGVSVTKEDLFNPEFNIQVGAIFLGILIDQHTDNNSVRFDKVVYRYNKGYFSKPADVDTEKLLALSNSETKSYILKLVGANGLLTLLA